MNIVENIIQHELLHESAAADREYLFAARAVEPSDLVLVAWAGGEAVGYLLASDQHEDGMFVWEHLVAPVYRHRGVGRALLHALATRALPGTIVQIDPAEFLDVERVADYYQRCGFTHERSGQRLWATASEVLNATQPAGRPFGDGGPVKDLLRSKAPGVVKVPPTATIRQAIDVLNAFHVGALVISGDGRTIDGIITERDVLVGVGRESERFLERRVEEVMTRQVVTCSVNDAVARVMALMTRRRVRHVPVTDNGQLIGIVSLGDVVLQRLQELERASC